MTKYVSILRGINVGGHRKILMKDLKALYVKLGFTQVVSYIQSGNVLFESKNTSISEMETKITEAIKKQFGFDVPVLVRKVSEFEDAVTLSPYYSEHCDIESLYFTFLSAKPSQSDIDALNQVDFGDDEFEILDGVVHAKIVPPYHKSKLSNQIIEKKLNCSATTRNWKTVNKLIELGQD